MSLFSVRGSEIKSAVVLLMVLLTPNVLYVYPALKCYTEADSSFLERSEDMYWFYHKINSVIIGWKTLYVVLTCDFFCLFVLF